MFFFAKSIFWLSIVAMAMPEAARDVAGGTYMAQAIVAARAPLPLGDLATKCLASTACRAAFVSAAQMSGSAAVPKAPGSRVAKTAKVPLKAGQSAATSAASHAPRNS